MKPNCLFSRLDRLNYQNGYYRVQMGLTEDILESVPPFLRRFDEVNASPVILGRGTVDRLLGISLYIERSTALRWTRLTKRNFAPLTLYGTISNWLDPNCCLSSLPPVWNVHSLGSKYLSCDRQNRQEPWQTYLTFSYLNV